MEQATGSDGQEAGDSVDAVTSAGPSGETMMGAAVIDGSATSDVLKVVILR